MLKSDKIQIIGNFDGGNPQDPDSIIQTGPNSFNIIPFSEDNDPNYKFRLDVKVYNHSSDSIKINLKIAWQETRFNHLRNYVYLKHEDDTEWIYHSMQVKRTKAFGTIECRSGETFICLHPKYNYGDYLRFLDGIPESEFIKKEKFGLSPEGRELWLIKINSVNTGKRPILIVSRIHPYETSASYCIEGIVNHSIEHLLHFSFLLSPVYLIPMANPDGVYNGLCKKTAVDGIDLSKEINHTDGMWQIIADLIDTIEPAIYCELHNWMFPEFDGIYFLNWLQAWRFIRKMPPQNRFQKRWRTILDRKIFAIPHHGFKQYCRERYNSLCLCLEYPWRHRSVSHMKQLGNDTVNALQQM